MLGPRIFSILLAFVAISIAPAEHGGAQAARPPVRETAAAAPPTLRPIPAQAKAGGQSAAQTDKSISGRLFEAPWVLFPARLALAIVFLTVAVLLLIGGSWAAARLAHSLRHLNWQQPPRRLKRGEVGAAGTTLAVEWEERLSTNIESDEERDRQIASLREVVDRLTKEHNELAATVAAMG
jgi:hypothetical protein